MRVLGSTTGNTGHFLPMVPVLHACAGAGHEVRVACPASFTAAVKAAGFLAEPFDDTPPEAWGRVMDRLPGMHPDEANLIVVEEVFGRIGAQAAFPGLAATVRRWRPDLVVRDWSEFAACVLGAREGLPSVTVSIGLLAMAERWADAAARGLAALAASQGVELRDDALLSGPVLASAPASFDPPPPHAGVTVHRYRAEEPDTDPDDLPLPAGDEPLVYVTFGTVAASVGAWPGVYRATLEGLADLPVRILVTTGSQVDPADLGPLPNRTRVARFVPQDAVLARAAVMVTHGGFGTVLGALRAGVPMVLAPLFADQPYNAARAAELGVGVVVPTTHDPSQAHPELAGAVRAATQRLLDDAGALAAAGALSQEMAEIPSARALLPTLKEFAHEAPA